MSCHGVSRRAVPRLLLAGGFALLSGAVSMVAQTTPAPPPPDAPQQTTPPASIPPATQVPASSVPAVPAYQDPLLTPVHVAPGPDTPAPVAVPPPTAASSIPSYAPYDFLPDEVNDRSLSSTYIPVDSWVYPMALRLYSLGYLDTAFIDMRPWTRLSLLHMLRESRDSITGDANPEALEIFAKLSSYIAAEAPVGPNLKRGTLYGVDTAYTRLLGINGQTLRDSFHLGQTLVNDYGRPYQAGFNNITGFSTVNEMGRFSLYVRGEYQHSPAGPGYSQALALQLATIDSATPYPGPNNVNLVQATIPTGPIAAMNPFRLQEATLSFHLLGHEISGGKSDAWVGPGLGGGMSWSDNAEDIYSFRINRVEPLHIPLLSRLMGPFRYDFFVGSLKGHTAPNEPWVHQETVSFAPTSNVEIGFQRTGIWGGHGHPCLLADGVTTVTCNEPITLHTFLKSFFSFTDTTGTQKESRSDPGARYSTFNFSWRLPFLRHYVTLYTDSIVHDDVTPPSAPRRAAYRPGLYLSQFPHLQKLDLRVEAASTDTSTLRSIGGEFNYWENVQRQGYTNKGFIMGDWIGREAKGGQAWLTYHLSGNEWVQLEYLNKKTPKDFIPGGTTQNQFKAEVVKRLHKDIELDAWFQYEAWKAPIYIANANNANNHDTVIAAQFTWYPRLRTAPGLNGK